MDPCLRIYPDISAELSEDLLYFPRCISACDEIFKQSMGGGNRVGIGLSYRPARLHRLAELIPLNRFLGPLKV